MGKCGLGFLIVVLSFLSGTAAHADSVTVGATTGSGYCGPFGCSPGTTHQQVYGRRQFTNLFLITQLDFFNTIQHSGGDQYIDSAYYEVWVSTTAAAVGGLNTIDFDANRGADATRVFAGVLGSPVDEVPPGPDSRLTFKWDAAFTYDPRRGNLLVDIRKTGGTVFGDDGTYLDFDDSGTADMSMATDLFGAWDNRRVGLVTRFNGEFGAEVNPAAVPEPGTMLLIGTGLAGGALAARKRAASRR